MLQRFYPDEYLDSTYVIDFDKLYEEGYRGIIFDIDNTLVPHGAPADERAKKLFSHLKELGYHCMLLSNNKEPRVKMFNDAVNVSYTRQGNRQRKIILRQWKRWEPPWRIRYLWETRYLLMCMGQTVRESVQFW